ncbi:MAG: Radical domain protein [Proteobacteria bacterium]|nr:Radical domain protein [Pseudomonadota bacterium]
MPDGQQILAATESVCPVCLQRIAAQRVAEGDNVYLVKHCATHGSYKTIIWRGLASYRRWAERGPRAAPPPVLETASQRGCPHDCGLCPEHRQHSCCVLLEVTQRCNLRCPVCFASASREADDPSLAEIETWLQRLLEHGNPVNIQLSGGEPTVRDDLPEIIRLIRARGFDFVQLNSNGLRLAKHAGYAEQLAAAGLDCVFLQFDGVSDRVYQQIRGADLRDLKEQAIAHCAAAGLGVVLVPTLVPGVNIDQIGAIVDFALQRLPTVRAVHFQPISYFGRYPNPPADADRITLPEVMAALETQTAGRIRVADLSPGSAENAFCSFSGKFFIDDQGRLQAANAASTDCCSKACGCGAPPPGEEAQRARRLVAKQWAAANPQRAPEDSAYPIEVSSFDRFLAARQHSFSISGMAFQDAWNLDLERLRECFIHVVSPDRRIIPFCAYNLTNLNGESLYRPTTCHHD